MTRTRCTGGLGGSSVAQRLASRHEAWRSIPSTAKKLHLKDKPEITDWSPMRRAGKEGSFSDGNGEVGTRKE